MTLPIYYLFVATVLMRTDVQADETAFQIICEGPLPFTKTELEAAPRFRWRLLGPPRDLTVLVRALAGGIVVIEIGTGRREIGIDNQIGEAAARIVALLAVDLMTEIAGSTADSTPPLPVAQKHHATSAGAALLVPFAANGWTPSVEPTVDFETNVSPRATLFASLGFTSLTAGSGAMSLRLRELPVRAGVGYNRAWLQLRIGGVLQSYFVDGAGRNQGIAWGATASALGRLPLTARLTLFLTAGLDAFRNRTQFRVDGQPILTTHWAALWVGAGITWRRVTP